MECDEGKCEDWKADGGRRSRMSVEVLSIRDCSALAASGFSPPDRVGEEVEVARGEGAFDPVTIGGDKTPSPPKTFFGKEARRFAKAAGRGGFDPLGGGSEIVGVLLDDDETSCLLAGPLADAFPAIILYFAKASWFTPPDPLLLGLDPA